MANSTVRRHIHRAHGKPVEQLVREKSEKSLWTPLEIANFLDVSERTVINIIKDQGGEIARVGRWRDANSNDSNP